MKLSSCCKRRDRADHHTIRKVRPRVWASLTHSSPRRQRPRAAVRVSSCGIWDTPPFLFRRRAPRNGDCILCRCTRKWAFELLIPSTAGAKAPKYRASVTRPLKGRSSTLDQSWNSSLAEKSLLSQGSLPKPEFLQPFESDDSPFGPPLLESICGEFANLKIRERGFARQRIATTLASTLAVSRAAMARRWARADNSQLSDAPADSPARGRGAAG